MMRNEVQDPIRFLTLDDVIEMHSLLIDQITPGEPKDILNAGRLEAAVMSPQQTFGGEYIYSSLYDMAATYLYGLAMGHAFQQGNKRIAFLSCYTFLQINGLELTLSNDEAIRLTLDVVNHVIDRDGVARVLREHTEPLD